MIQQSTTTTTTTNLLAASLLSQQLPNPFENTAVQLPSFGGGSDDDDNNEDDDTAAEDSSTTKVSSLVGGTNTANALIMQAKRVIESDFGLLEPELLDDERFMYIDPYIDINGFPLGKIDYLASISFFNLRQTIFPDLDYRPHDFRIVNDITTTGNDSSNSIDSKTATVRFTCRTTGTMIRGGELRLRTGTVITPTDGDNVMMCPPEAVSITFDLSSGKVIKLCSGFVLDRQVGNTDGTTGIVAAAIMAKAPGSIISDWELYPPITVIQRFFGRPILPLPGGEMTSYLAPFPETVMIQLAKGVISANMGLNDPTLLSNDGEFCYMTPFVGGPINKKQYLEEQYASELMFNNIEDMNFNYNNFRVDPYDPKRVWVDIQPTTTNYIGSPEAISFTFDNAGYCTRITAGAIVDPSIMGSGTNGGGGLSGIEGYKYSIGDASIPILTRPMPIIWGRIRKRILSIFTNIDVDEYKLLSTSTTSGRRLGDTTTTSTKQQQQKQQQQQRLPSPPTGMPPPMKKLRDLSDLVSVPPPPKITNMIMNSIESTTASLQDVIIPKLPTIPTMNNNNNINNNKESSTKAVAVIPKPPQPPITRPKPPPMSPSIIQKQQRVEAERKKKAAAAKQQQQQQEKQEAERRRKQLEAQQRQQQQAAAAAAARQRQLKAEQLRKEQEEKQMMMKQAQAERNKKQRERAFEIEESKREAQRLELIEKRRSIELLKQKEQERKDLIQQQTLAKRRAQQEEIERRKRNVQQAKLDEQARKDAAIQAIRYKQKAAKEEAERKRNEAEQIRRDTQARKEAEARDARERIRIQKAEADRKRMLSEQAKKDEQAKKQAQAKAAREAMLTRQRIEKERKQKAAAEAKARSQAQIQAARERQLAQKTAMASKQRKQAEEAKALQELKKARQAEVAKRQAERAEEVRQRKLEADRRKKILDEQRAAQQRVKKVEMDRKALEMERKRLQQADFVQRQREAREQQRKQKVVANKATADQKKREQAALDLLSNAASRATITLFGLASDDDDEPPPPTSSSLLASRRNSKVTTVAPRGVPTLSRWRSNSDRSITGRISGSKAFGEGERITTSPISRGTVSGGEVVYTASGSRYFLAPTGVGVGVGFFGGGGLLGGGSNSNSRVSTADQNKQKKKKQREKAALERVSNAAPRGTINLFGLGGGDDDDDEPPPVKKQQQQQQKTKKIAPRGVPTLSRWRSNFNGSITGRISGSKSFDDGERVTTSAISKGTISSGEVVSTSSGSRYFLE